MLNLVLQSNFLCRIEPIGMELPKSRAARQKAPNKLPAANKLEKNGRSCFIHETKIRPAELRFFDAYRKKNI